MIGQTLSHYRITAAIGAGGMGEVYRATDTKLGRDIAIKILPPEVAHDPERLARFQREAHLLASLNHPNIAAIYGLEEADGKPLLALELVEGEDLKERLAKGPIPVDEALEVAEQIAEALEEAHNKGIVHRDLKPANVKLTPDGKVKVLDFGLAKAWGGDSGAGASSVDLSQSPTVAHTGTQAGVILGTAAYMSPEQARGRPVDKRADIWAFGVVLFEMLAGKPLFAGETVSDVLASVLKVEPEWALLPAETPARLRELLHRCLRRDERRRLHDIADARLEIEDARAHGPETGEPGGPLDTKPAARWRRTLPWAIALASVLGGGYLASRQAPSTPPVMHVEVTSPEGLVFGAAEGDGPVLSPDGRRLAFVAPGAKGHLRLYIRRLAAPGLRELPGTEDATYPFWSPDSRFVGFFARGKLWTLEIEGGSPVPLCDAPAARGGTWSPGGIIAFAPSYIGSLHRVSATGGECGPIAETSSGPPQRSPHFLPDGRHVLFAQGDSVRVGSLDGTEAKVLVRSQAGAVFASGHLLYVSDGKLVARPFDPDRLEFTGEAATLAAGVAVSPTQHYAFFSSSQTGLLSFLTGQPNPDSTLRWYDRSGKAQGTLGDVAKYLDVQLAPDGARAAVSIVDKNGHADVWIYDIARNLRTRLTFEPWAARPIWFPDSRSLVFSSVRAGHFDLYQKRVDGSGNVEALYTSENEKWANDVSADGQWLSFTQAGEGTLYDTWLLPLDGDSEPRPFLQTPFNVTDGAFSPDGRWLAYVSDESGRREIYVTAVPETGRKQQVSTSGGSQPFWRRDGRELFYQTLEGDLVAVAVHHSEDVLTFGAQEPLFSGRRSDFWRYVTASPDGQRFLVVTPEEQQSAHPLQLIQNWPQLVRQGQ